MFSGIHYTHTLTTHKTFINFVRFQFGFLFTFKMFSADWLSVCIGKQFKIMVFYSKDCVYIENSPIKMAHDVVHDISYYASI